MLRRGIVRDYFKPPGLVEVFVVGTAVEVRADFGVAEEGVGLSVVDAVASGAA